MPATTTYSVEGMTCRHCVASVREEVAEVPGVEELTVDLEPGRLVVVGNADAEAVRAAVAEAGYTVVGP